MEFLYYTLTCITLYFLADWILDRIEAFHGSRFEYRTVNFFVIILALASGTFRIFRALATGES